MEGFRYSLCVLVFVLIIDTSVLKFDEQSINSVSIELNPTNFVAELSTHKTYFSASFGILDSIYNVRRSSASSANTSVNHRNVNYSFLTLILLLSGDVHPCPGPTPKHPCIACSRAVRSNSKAISCDLCLKWVHIKCCDMSVEKYNELATSQEEFSFICDKCVSNIFPFQHCDIDCDETDSAHRDAPTLEGVNLDFAKQKGLHFLHLNARSILPKMTDLRLLANKCNATVIGVSETWLDNSVSDNEISIDGYAVYRKDRSRSGGGVCIYVKSELCSNRKPEMESDDLEAIWIEISLPKTKPIIIGVGYRPPRQCDFFSKLESSFLKCDRLSESEVYFLGDFNVNLFAQNNSNSLYKSLREWSSIFDFHQIIAEATRETDHSSTLLDHIYVSSKDHIAQSGVLNYGLSDHSVIFCTRKIARGFHKGHKTVKVRSLKNYSVDGFNSELNQTDWSDLFLCQDVNEAMCIFNNKLLAVLDKVAPIKQVRIKQNSEPWVTSQILDAINHRDSLYYKFRKHKSSDLYSDYCQARNKVQKLVKSAKTNYINNQIDLNKNKSKQLWNTLKQLGYSDKKKQASAISLCVDNTNIFDSEMVASEFNKFYTSVADELVRTLPGCDDSNITSPTAFYQNKGITPNAFALHTVSEQEVLDFLSDLNPKKSVGLDGISSKFLFDGRSTIKKHLLHIFNLSISSGCVPDVLKSAKVVPIHKKDNKRDVSNYRPVSILCSTSKILEKIVYNQVESYLLKNNILFDFQSGFRQNFSTDTCLIHITDYIKSEISLGRYVGMVLIDLRKAFDTVNHSIMCQKLEAIGFDQSTVAWFKSYLQNRTQLVNVNGVFSDKRNISCGVPQGSVLGPLLFNLYINDMQSSVSCKLMLYADDAALIVSHKDYNTVESNLSDNLYSLNNWLIHNKLSLHLGKTQSILFASKRKLKIHSHLNVTCGRTPIESVKKTKYLGLKLNQNMDSSDIVTNIISKCNSRLKFMYRQAKHLPISAKKTLSNALIMCHFDYCSSAWSSSLTKDQAKKLQILQNKVVRFIFNFGNRTHVGPEELDKLGWLDTYHRSLQLKANHVHDIYYNNSPAYLQSNFVKVSNMHRYNTRSCNYNFFVPQVKGLQSATFYYSAITLWNSLPADLKNTSCKNSFKSKVKEFYSSEMSRIESQVFYYY